jgi:hypothetical protein
MRPSGAQERGLSQARDLEELPEDRRHPRHASRGRKDPRGERVKHPNDAQCRRFADYPATRTGKYQTTQVAGPSAKAAAIL